MSQRKQTFSYSHIPLDDLSATDLRMEAWKAVEEATHIALGMKDAYGWHYPESLPGGDIDNLNLEAYMITIRDANEKLYAETAEALYFSVHHRLGIAWGTDATWADIDDLESGIEMWLNDPDAWNQRN